MKNPCVKMGGGVSKLIGFTPDYFDYGTIWDALPAGLYINYLSPKEGKEDEAIEQLLDNLERLRIRARFIAPTPLIIKHLKKHGYFFYKDPAGTPNWIRLSEKGIALLCGKLRITPEQLAQQSKDYVV